MPVVVSVILLVLFLLIVAGPVLEGMIDFFWPPRRHRPRTGEHAGPPTAKAGT